MGWKYIYDDYVSILTLRRSAQFLRSFEKQREAELPTFLLKINELVTDWEKEKICAPGSNIESHVLQRARYR